MEQTGFKSKKDPVLNHWIFFADSFHHSPQDFYTAVEKELEARKIPSMDMKRVEFAEGGFLSSKRVYLRMVRERLIFDICAAPFGKQYFFSCRTVFVPPVIEPWHIVVVCLFFGMVYSLLARLLGSTFAAIALVALVVAIAQMFRNTIAMGLTDVDAALMKIPVIGPIYELLFRKETYYRHDTRLLYLHIIPAVVKKLAEDVTAHHGVKLVQQYQLAPVFGDLYKPVPHSDKPN